MGSPTRDSSEQRTGDEAVKIQGTIVTYKIKFTIDFSSFKGRKVL